MMTKVTVPNPRELKDAIFVVHHINTDTDALTWAAFNAALIGARLANDQAQHITNYTLMLRLMDDMREHDTKFHLDAYRFPSWFTKEITALVLRGQAELRAIKLEDIG